MLRRLKNWLNGPRRRDRRLDRFVCVLRQSQLCPEQQIEKLASEFGSDGGRIAKRDLVTDFCRFLIDKNVVTAWQCDKLKAGRYKGFYLDDYVLLEQVGKDYEYAYFRALDKRDGSIVRLVVTPMNRSANRRIEYRVEPAS